MAKEHSIYEAAVEARPSSFSLFLPHDQYNELQANVQASFSGLTVAEIAETDPEEAFGIVRTRALEDLLRAKALEAASTKLSDTDGLRMNSFMANLVARGLPWSIIDGYIQPSARKRLFTDDRYHPAPLHHDLTVELGRLPRYKNSRGQQYVQTRAGFRSLTDYRSFIVPGVLGKETAPPETSQSMRIGLFGNLSGLSIRVNGRDVTEEYIERMSE